MKSQVKILLILFLVLVAVFAYASFWNGDNDENIIKKISLSELTADVSLSDDTVALSESDSVLTAKQQPEVSPLDTTPQNILLFGESMVEGLSRPFADYCTSNGHQFNSVCWYSSTTKHWAKTDTLRYFLNKFNPTYVLISVGGNEQFVKDLDVREKYIRQMLKVLEGRKVVWIGTPAWKKDTGINELTQKIVGKDRYFDSRNLKLDRRSDHAHPTPKAACVWMDSIAAWISGDANRNPIILKKHDQHAKSKNLTILQPMNM